EHDYLVGNVSNPRKTFVAIVGGSKVLSKVGLTESLLNKVEIIILGGGMIFTFLKAQGLAVGSSLVEEDKLIPATSLLEKAKARLVSLLLSSDVVIADKFALDANMKVAGRGLIDALLPGLKSRISHVLVSVAKEHASYGEITESKAGMGALLLNILSKYSEAFSSMIEGKNKEMSTSELS
nr:putative phospho-glycerate kinase [Tanacetum cinerariifolium]